MTCTDGEAIENNNRTRGNESFVFLVTLLSGIIPFESEWRGAGSDLKPRCSNPKPCFQNPHNLPSPQKKSQWYVCRSYNFCSLLSSTKTLCVDILNRDNDKNRHKLDRNVPDPDSYFMDVKCPGMFADVPQL